MLRSPKVDCCCFAAPFRKALYGQQEGRSCQWAETWAVHLAFCLVGAEGKMEGGVDLHELMGNS